MFNSSLEDFLYNKLTTPFSIKKELDLLSLRGDDALQFLNSQITVDISDKHWLLAGLTDVDGKYFGHFYVHVHNQSHVDLLCDSGELTYIESRLNKYLVSEDVEFFKNENQEVNFDLDFAGSVDFYGIPSKLVASCSYPEIDSKTLNMFRINYGYPLVGLDVSYDDLFVNTSLSQIAYDASAGCFPGQEIVGKIMSRRGPVYLSTVIKSQGSKSLNLGKYGKIGSQEQSFYLARIKRDYRVDYRLIELENNSFKQLGLPAVSLEKSSISKKFYEIALSEHHNNNDIRAISLLETAILLNPLFEDAVEILGVILGKLNKVEEAIVLMEKVIKINPLSVMAYSNLSVFYLKLGDKETAEKYKAEATFKQFESLGKAAELEELKTREAESIIQEDLRREQMFKEVLSIDGEDALANFGMGEVLSNRKDFDKAIEHYKTAISTNAKYSVAYLGLAKAYLASDDNLKAKKVLENGITVASKNGDLMPANEMQQLLNRV